jgi:dihydrofolate synthase/folylpolyglutamate synthase
VDPDGAIITNIALEHCDWLGDNVEAIAREKAGVMRASIPVVFGAATVPASIVGEAGRIGADLWLCGRDFDYAADESGNGAGTWHWRGRDLAIDGLAPPSLRGTFQLQNAAAVLALVESLQLARLLTREHVDTAFGRLEISGRLQRVTTRREWLLDVAHNPDAARVLGESLDRMRVGSTCPGGVTAVIGVLADKDLAGIVQPLLPHVDRWIAVTAGSPRALPARDVAQLIARLADKPCLVAESIPATMKYLEERANPGELLLVTGSFFTVGPALAWLENPGNARSV